MTFNRVYRYDLVDVMLDAGLKFLSTGNLCDYRKEIDSRYVINVSSYYDGTRENANTCNNIVLGIVDEALGKPLFDIDIFNGFFRVDFYDNKDTTLDIDFSEYTSEPELTEEMYFQMQCVMNLDCIQYQELKKIYEIGYNIKRTS